MWAFSQLRDFCSLNPFFKMNSYRNYTQAIGLILMLAVSIQIKGQPFNDQLPEDFTTIHSEIFTEPQTGEYFFLGYMGAWGQFPDLTPYLIISDNYGTPVFYKKFSQDVMDFKVQPNGLLTYFESQRNCHIIMDLKYNEIGQVPYIGQMIDFHDFHILENGNYLLLGLEPRLVDMDTVVPGGHEGVTVVGTHIHIQNPNGNIIFQWSAWDHFEITDSYADLYDENYVDFTHTNALEMDTDSTLLMSHRNMHEISKINMNSGEVIWRLGGKNNQFTYTDHDTLGFAGQHDIRRLPNGLYQIFDNGWNHEPPFSCVLQLDLDEENMIANVVKRLRSQPEDIMGWIMGNAQTHNDGRIVVGWGDGDPNITEFDPDGNKIVEFSYEATSYRAYKFPWETTAIGFDAELLDCGEAQPGNATEGKIGIKNYLDREIEINNLVSRTGLFDATGEFPLVIPAGELRELSVEFSADTIGVFHDVLTICNDIEHDTLTQRIAKQISVTAESSEDADIYEDDQANVRIFPNPCQDLLKIHFYNYGRKECEVFNVQGKKVHHFVTEKSNTEINFVGHPPGIYFVKIRYDNGMVFHSRIIKQ